MVHGLFAAQTNIGYMFLIGVLLFGLFLLLIVLAVFMSYFRWWIQSFLTGAGVTFFDLLGMTFRKVKPSVIVTSKIMAVQAGLSDPDMTTKALEAHYLAGGNVPLVIRALIAANKAKTITLSFREATAIDLAGRNVLEAVQAMEEDAATFVDDRQGPPPERDLGVTGPLYEGPDFGDEPDGAGTAAAQPAQPNSRAAEPSSAKSEDSAVAAAAVFETLGELPDDLSDAIDQLKIAILRHKLAGWTEVGADQVLRALDGLRLLVGGEPASP